MFKNIFGWFLGLFKDAAKALEKPAEVCNKIVNIIKDYISNPIVDIFTSLTRTGIDNKVVDIVRMYLPGILSGMLKAENIIKDLTKGDVGSLLKIFSEHMNSITAAARGKWWADLAALLLQAIVGNLNGKPVEKPLAMAMTQATYLKNTSKLTA